jgi:hypothetical protein
MGRRGSHNENKNHTDEEFTAIGKEAKQCQSFVKNR